MNRQHTTQARPLQVAQGTGLLSSDPVRSFERAQTVFRQGETGSVWRLVQGWVRIDRQLGQRHLLVQLAQPGDLLGAEVFCGLAYPYSATAFSACVLERLRPGGGADAPHTWLQQVLQQQLRQSAFMTLLRTGPVPQRLAHLLDALGQDWRVPAQAAAIRKWLPPLRELADVVDAKTETVCRALAQLMPHQGRSALASLERAMPGPEAMPWQDAEPVAQWQPKAA
ncbi:MAG TPA: cyclic nucleotide-binding domain-containing protein [Macromonas sp.]|nr:cyclic nucleotide-binding domain-containing protein [Macromonas sp.]